MGVSKTEGFNAEQNRLAEIAKALGHPARIAILQEIMQKDRCICNDLVDKLPLSQATISQHLKALKKVKLIKGEVEAPRICYCINKETWESVQRSWHSFFESVKGCC